MHEHGEVPRFRDCCIPLIRLAHVFNFSSSGNTADSLVIVVDDENNTMLALAAAAAEFRTQKTQPSGPEDDATRRRRFKFLRKLALEEADSSPAGHK